VERPHCDNCENEIPDRERRFTGDVSIHDSRDGGSNISDRSGSFVLCVGCGLLLKRLLHNALKAAA
jgi:hypothetical protein